MKIQIHSPHLKVSQHLKLFIDQKIGAIDHIAHNLDHCNIYLNIETKHKIKDKIVELKIHHRSQEIFVKKHSETFEDATLQAINTMKQLLDKSNKKHRDKKRVGLRRALKKLFR